MRRLFALILGVVLWLGLSPAAFADQTTSLLVPCKESAVFQQRAKANIGGVSASDRFQKYVDADMLCGREDGLPRIIADGNLKHAGEFIVPGLLFLYLAGWLGWAGRNYLSVTRKSDTPEYNEIQINVPLAIKSFLTSLLWPLQAVKEILSGEIQEADDKIAVSRR
ncbi:MAG TPA: Photosystem I reaction center subunit III [Thermosynechococcaceae cyanobacterium]